MNNARNIEVSVRAVTNLSGWEQLWRWLLDDPPENETAADNLQEDSGPAQTNPGAESNEPSE